LRPGFVRVGLYSFLALAFASALRFTPRLPDPERKAAEVLASTGASSWKLRFDTLDRGESLQSLLRRGGLTDSAVARVMHAASSTASLDQRRIPAGMPVTIRSEASQSLPSEITLQLSTDRLLRLRRTGDSWTGVEERLPWTTDTIVVSGTIASNLYAAMDASAKSDLPVGARQQLAWALADVYEYRVDMSRDLQVGDAFKVVAERSVAPSGATRIGRVIAATFSLSGVTINVVRFASSSVSGDYFDQDGKSMRAAFLRAPLEFRRISSIFGMREHPILGGVREHKGTDYAAAIGTPVRAIGDGVVVREGWSNGYGNLMEIRHRNGYITRYGHLSRFSSVVHVGTRVSIGQVIAFVGSTGLSTGPHLHFEVLVNGEQRDPRVALKQTGGDPIPVAERDSFSVVRNRLLTSIDSTSSGVTKLEIR